MEPEIPGLSNTIFPKMSTKGNATPIIPMPFLKKRYDRTRGCALDDINIPFLQFLGRSQRFSSQTMCYFYLSMDMSWQIDVSILTFSLIDLLIDAVTFIWNGHVYLSILCLRVGFPELSSSLAT